MIEYCLLPLIVLIMLCSVVNGDPPTALTSGLLNTAATGDTTIAGTTLSYGFTSQTTTGMPQSVYVGMVSTANVANNIKIFTYGLSIACMATTGSAGVRALVIKGPGKVFAGSSSTTSRLLYTISYTASTYAMALTSTVASISTLTMCGDEDSTNNYAYSTSSNPSNMFNKIDMSTGIETSQVSVASVNSCAAGPSINYFVMTGNSNIIIRLKTDLSNFGTATRSGGPAGGTGMAILDNLNSGMLYYFAGGGAAYALVKANLNTATSTSVLEIMLWTVTNSYGNMGRPLNFGPYQYVVTLTLLTGTASVVVMDKNSNTPAIAALFATGNAMNYATGTVAGTIIDCSSGQPRVYITGITDSATGKWNMQSYYLTEIGRAHV